MRILVSIDADNEAFEDNLNYELAKCLAQVRAVDGLKIRDTNGNTVGEVRVEED